MHIGQLPLSAAATLLAVAPATTFLAAGPATAAQPRPAHAPAERPAYAAPARPAHAAARGEAAARVAATSLSPRAVDRGGKVEISVTGCPGSTARAYSDAFAEPADLGPRGSGGHSALRADARVRPGARLGAHQVRIACGVVDGTEKGRAATASEPQLGGTFRVLAEGAEGRAGSVAAPQLAAQPQLAGPGARHAVTGLVLASAAAVAMALRSSRRGREAGASGKAGR